MFCSVTDCNIWSLSSFLQIFRGNFQAGPDRVPKWSSDTIEALYNLASVPDLMLSGAQSMTNRMRATPNGTLSSTGTLLSTVFDNGTFPSIEPVFGVSFTTRANFSIAWTWMSLLAPSTSSHASIFLCCSMGSAIEPDRS